MHGMTDRDREGSLTIIGLIADAVESVGISTNDQRSSSKMREIIKRILNRVNQALIPSYKETKEYPIDRLVALLCVPYVSALMGVGRASSTVEKRSVVATIQYFLRESIIVFLSSRLHSRFDKEPDDSNMSQLALCIEPHFSFP